ncbi:hypothetical protein Tco_0845878, partial [Tanacetum coccineum]
SLWVTEEEFGIRYLDLKPASSLSSKSVHATASGNVSNMPSELPKHHDSNALGSNLRSKPSEGKHESVTGHAKVKGSSLSNGSDASTSVESHRQIDDSANGISENATKGTVGKRSVTTASVLKQPKPNLVKIDTKPKPFGTIDEASAIAKGSTLSTR